MTTDYTDEEASMKPDENSLSYSENQHNSIHKKKIKNYLITTSDFQDYIPRILKSDAKDILEWLSSRDDEYRFYTPKEIVKKRGPRPCERQIYRILDILEELEFIYRGENNFIGINYDRIEKKIIELKNSSKQLTISQKQLIINATKLTNSQDSLTNSQKSLTISQNKLSQNIPVAECNYSEQYGSDNNSDKNSYKNNVIHGDFKNEDCDEIRTEQRVVEKKTNQVKKSADDVRLHNGNFLYSIWKSCGLFPSFENDACLIRIIKKIEKINRGHGITIADCKTCIENYAHVLKSNEVAECYKNFKSFSTFFEKGFYTQFKNLEIALAEKRDFKLKSTASIKIRKEYVWITIVNANQDLFDEYWNDLTADEQKILVDRDNCRALLRKSTFEIERFLSKYI